LEFRDISRVSEAITAKRMKTGSSGGWAKNQLGERRLGELFFG